MYRLTPPTSAHTLPITLSLACACLLGTQSESQALASPVIDPTDSHLVVRLLPGTDPGPLASALRGRTVRSRDAQGLHLIHIPGATAAQLEAASGVLSNLPTVLYAEADEDADPPESKGCGLPDGEAAAQQCTVAFTDGTPSVTSYTAQYALAQIQGDEAHALATGVPIVIAVIDSGLDLAHPLFAGRIAPGGWDYLLDVPGGADVANGLDDDGDSAVDEGAGHGSHVAGLAILADPAALIMPLRVLDSDGNGSAFLVACAIYDAVDAGAHVINLSLSTRHQCDVIAEALMYAEYHGVEVVTSSGNAGPITMFPGDYDPAAYTHLNPTWLPTGTTLTGANLTTVLAIDDQSIKPDFATYGPQVDVATGGVDVYSAQLGGKYAWWSGTSMSSGLAAGSISFLLSIWGQGSYAGSASALLIEEADELDTLNPAYAGQLGSGRVNLLSAASTLLGL